MFISVMLVIGLFGLVMVCTNDVWAATNVAGIVCVGFLVGVAVRLTHLYHSLTQRITVGALSTIVITALVLHWVMLWRMTEWQCGKLQDTRRVVFDGAMWSVMRPPALETYQAFCTSNPKKTFSDLFDHHVPSGPLRLDSLNEREEGETYASVTDTSMDFIGVARSVPGGDPDFVNHDGRKGMAQIDVHVNARGVTRNAQN